MADNKITIGYWAGPGKAQPSRYLLELAGVEYNDVRYTNPADWFGRDKYALGLDFPNLPYVLDGNVRLTESETILDYLVHRLNKTELLGKEADKYTVDTLRNLLSDLGSRVYLYTLKTGEEKAKHLAEQLVPKYNDLKKFLGTKDFLVGYLTVADLYFYGVVNFLKKSIPETYVDYAATFDPFLERFAAIPQIAAYIASGRHP